MIATKISIFVSVTLVVICNLFNIQDNLLNKESLENAILQENYPAETHKVLTEDGFILTIHRIPGRTGSIPVYLQHGLLSSSADWLKSGKGRSLAYILSDNGYDVWMGNARGNVYSQEHVKLSSSEPQFWNFSWHEVGFYDVSATILYISKITNNTMFYVGHSMGGSTFAVMATQRPRMADNVRAMIGLVPAVYESHTRHHLLKAIAVHWETLQSFAHTLGIHKFLTWNIFTDLFFHQLSKVPIIGRAYASNLLFYIFGYNPDQLDYAKLPVFMDKLPAGTSIRLFCHWLQQMTVNEFRNFDYGRQTNLMIYNSTEPPKYDLTKIKVPVAVFLSDNDILVTAEDIVHFYEQVPNKIGLYDVGHGFNHGDFIWGINATELVYNIILDIFKNQR
ncbi:lipase 3 isoform X2 [Nasonia vitripennis]|uniref:Lipase n=1 Tax=Nasonia vitripennis TaxID=7425 RepID=A0A7M7TEG6_NASVI|nr:lipase 3 isoform X2 [Nasonia vitripennis]